MGWSVLRRVGWLVACFALVVSGALSGPVWADGPISPSVESVVRPDWVSASVTARSLGVRVEVLSERSETAQVWVNPDGSVTQETASGQVRFRDGEAADGWRDIDTDLVRSGAGISAAALPSRTVLGTGSADVVTVDAGGPGELAVALPGLVLPEPKLEGPRAVYGEVLPGVDVSVEVRSSGFELLWVVKTPAAAKELGRRYGTSSGVVMPTLVRSKGVVAPAGVDGTVEVRDVKGKRLGRFGSPVMWDSASKVPGERGQSKRVDFRVGGKVQGRGRGVGVSADSVWLTDPARVFPIVIDPTYVMDSGLPVFDTFVQQGFTSDQSGSAELKLGNNGSGQVARSFMNFNASLFKGRQVLSSTLSLFESWSYNCSARPFSAWDAGLASTSSRWTAQPSVGAKRATQTAAAGYSASCPGARVQIDMTAQAKAWSASSAAQVGVMLRADDEADVVSWKRFHSSEGQWKPVISVTYNRAPVVPKAPSVQGLVSAATVTGARQFVGSTQPVLSVVVSDPDANTARASFAVFASAASTASPVALCQSGFVASGGTASCVPSGGLLVDNSTVWVRATVTDGVGAWSGWGPAVEVRIATSAPMAPRVSCPSVNGSWGDTVKAAENCVINLPVDPARATSAPTKVRWQVNGGAWKEVTKNQPTPTSPNSYNVTIGGTAGSHTLKAQTVSPTGKASTITTYQFGYGLGVATLTTPVAGSVPTTHSSLAVTASGPAKGGASSVMGVVQWRVKGTGDSGWVDAGIASSTSQVNNMTAFATSFNTAALVGKSDGAGITVPERTAVVLQVRVKLTYTGTGTSYSGLADVIRVPHAFGDSFPTTKAGNGTVALWTGEFQARETDAELSTPDGNLSVSRVHSTNGGVPDPRNAVFGPGWVAAFGGDLGEMPDAELVDNTLLDGMLVLVDAEGTALPFALPGKGRRTNSAVIPAGTYLPVGSEAEASGYRITVTGDARFLVVGEDGVTTGYRVSAPASVNTAAEFVAVEVTDPAVAGRTTYSYDAAGRVTAITAGLPDGVTACPVNGSVPGCRVLRIAYATSTTATSALAGDFTGNVKSIIAEVNGEPQRQLASYAYDNRGRMVSQTDTVTGLSTTYTWDGGSSVTPRLASVTPPGQATISYTYSENKLSKVTRPVPVTAGGGTAQLAAFVYDIAPEAMGIAGLTSQFADYELPRKASKGFAVFGPDQPVTTTPAAGDPKWRRADVWLTDTDGYTIHKGSYGAGDWQLTAAVYDEYDNVVLAWDTRATAGIKDGQVSDIRSAATETIYNQEVNSGGSNPMVLIPAGTRVTDVYSPASMILADGASNEELLRRHLRTEFDHGAPNNGINPATSRPYSLPTAATVTAERIDKTPVETLTTTWTGYGAETIDGAAPRKTGWDFGEATSTTLDMNGNATADADDLVRENRYDSKGRKVEERKPGSTGTDAATRSTVYWAAGSNPRDAACGGQPGWAGYVCKAGPADPNAGIPTTQTSDYRWDGQAVTQTETSGPATRTTTTGFDAKSRPTTVTTTVVGLPSSLPLPAVTTTYDNATGQITGTNSTAGSTVFTYDSWGRQLTYTITQPGGMPETTTTVYDQIGQVAKRTTPRGATTYTWDGTDANGQPETRGLLTAVTTNVNGYAATASGAYDAFGKLTLEKLPGNINRRTSYDLTGELISQSYSGQLTIDGTPTADQPWVAWSTRANAAGQIVREWTPEGAALTGDLPGTPAGWADLNYTYDGAGRLVTVTDLSANTLNGTQTCTTRKYSFDKRGNRTKQSTNTGQPGQGCSTAEGTTRTHTYDKADRVLNGAGGQGNYVYDSLGRQTTIPATDAPNPNNGNLSLEYYHNDAARRIQQGNITDQFSLDVAGRRSTQTTYQGTNNTQLKQVTNHYTDGSDNPSWITHTAGGTTATTVYTELLNGNLTLSIITDGKGSRGELALTTPRGDIAATITLPNPNQTAEGLDSWTRYTEYGKPTTTQPTNTTGAAANGYGWLGAQQRTTTDTGITLMGARLYNPTTGLFTSLDPIQDGNETTYGYPNDPINKQDTTGKSWFKSLLSVASKVLSVASAVGCVVGGPVACTALSVASAVVGSTNDMTDSRGRFRWSWRAAGKAAVGLAASTLAPLRAIKSLRGFTRAKLSLGIVRPRGTPGFSWSMAGRWNQRSAYVSAWKNAARRGWKGKTAYSLRVASVGNGFYGGMS